MSKEQICENCIFWNREKTVWARNTVTIHTGPFRLHPCIRIQVEGQPLFTFDKTDCFSSDLFELIEDEDADALRQN